MTDSGKDYQLLLELLGECLLGNMIFIDYSGRLYFLKMATTEFLIPHTLCNVTLPLLHQELEFNSFPHASFSDLYVIGRM